MSNRIGWSVLPVVACAGLGFAQTQTVVETEAVPEESDERIVETRDVATGDRAEGYEGGRGLVTLSGLSGMFYNPTSGTLYEGQLTAQYCLINFNTDGDGPNNMGHGIMATYGATDWLEVGGFANFLEDRAGDTGRFVFGPLARVRLMKDEGAMPELSIGTIYLDGDDAEDDALSKWELFAAASKGIELDEDGFFRSARVHGGFRYIMRPEHPDGVDDVFSTLFVGGEVELPYRIFAVAEVNTKDLSSHDDMHTPYAFGLQWKPNNVVGVSVAGIQGENDINLAFWFGVGLTFNF